MVAVSQIASLAGLTLLVGGAAAACANDPPDDGAVDVFATRGWVGVAVDAAGTRYVLHDREGLFQVGAGDARTMVLALGAMPAPAPGGSLQPPFTELAAIGPDRFAITAIGEGYILDAGEGTLTRHFCYVPGGPLGVLYQRTDALAVDVDADRIYAQPRSYIQWDDDPLATLESSWVATYSATTGQALEWQAMPRTFAADGMAVVGGVGVVAGEKQRLYTFGPAGPVELANLTRLGVTEIAGLTVDSTTAQLVVLDRTGRLVDIALADLQR